MSLNKGLVFGVLLFAFAALASAVTQVSCLGTAIMPIESGTFISCAVNELIPGAGGSTVITMGGTFCVKVTKFYQPLSDHRINVKLLNGATCADWSSGDYCYDKMEVGQACNKDMVPGNNFLFGNPEGDRVIYNYQLYINAYGCSLQPIFPFGMLYQNIITLPPAKCSKAQPVIAAAKAKAVSKAKTLASPRAFKKR